jgi:uracil-DNA glycosylase
MYPIHLYYSESWQYIRPSRHMGHNKSHSPTKEAITEIFHVLTRQTWAITYKLVLLHGKYTFKHLN